jgi:hypothetical protein
LPTQNHPFMFKRTLLFFSLVLTVQFLGAQVKSPDEYLNYKLGSRYTPHWKIVNYVNYVAATAPGMVSVQSYGETNEGRPLMLAFVQ